MVKALTLLYGIPIEGLSPFLTRKEKENKEGNAKLNRPLNIVLCFFHASTKSLNYSH